MTSRLLTFAVASLFLLAASCTKDGEKAKPPTKPSGSENSGAKPAANTDGPTGPAKATKPAEPKEPAGVSPPSAKEGAKPSAPAPKRQAAPSTAAKTPVDCDAVCSKQLSCAVAPGGGVKGFAGDAGPAKKQCIYACNATTGSATTKKTTFHAVSECLDKPCSAGFNACVATTLGMSPSAKPAAPTLKCAALCAKQLSCAAAASGPAADPTAAQSQCVRTCGATKGAARTNFHAVAECMDKDCAKAFPDCMAQALKANKPPVAAPTAPAKGPTAP